MSSVFAIGTAWTLASLAIALWVVRAAIAYARRRGLLDLPGQRRSHDLPTPRGGGIGIVVACLVSVPGALYSLAEDGRGGATATGLAVALVLVAAIGWWDDHRPLRPWPRLAVQLVACGIFAAALLAPGAAWGWLPLLVLAGAWSINLHNFMDGIDALLAQQGIFVGLGLAALAMSTGAHGLAGASLAMAAACLGFWWYNRSPARIFMGDVGSGSVGLLVFALTAMLWAIRPALLWPALILSSSFIADATFTLLSRVLRQRRWYAPHREHAYQWMVRSGLTHAQAARAYLGWNLLVAAPVAWIATRWPFLAMPACAGIYAAAGVTWIVSKRRLARRVSQRGLHVAT